MSLERKCLLFFGSALMFLMFGAFLVVEKLGRELVKNTTRTRARDFSAAEVLRIHSDATWASGQPEDQIESKRETLGALQEVLLDDNLDIATEYQILALDNGSRFDQLSTNFSTDPTEILLLEKLEQDYRSRLAERIQVDRPDVTRPLDLAENEPMSQIGPSLASPLYSEEGPINGRYIYYTPIFFTIECMACHTSPDSLSIDPNDRDRKLEDVTGWKIVATIYRIGNLFSGP